ncbi:MAG: right-handed parallel beta-helix repeat-containing protein [Candidatus Bathyarchaeales archaeon]
MKINVRSLVILLTVIFGALSVSFTVSPCKADGVYVEGPIMQDTLWTLIDSPIVIVKNVTVYPGATLTIEPGVEVRFGGNFSLVVSGKLSAVGTYERPIIFTSNKEQKNAGDWGSIIFNGTEMSVLTNCLISYSKDGIMIANGCVNMQDSSVLFSENGIAVTNGVLNTQNLTVSSCVKNGINITDSTVNIQNSHISNNGENGVSITGNCQVKIENTTVIGSGSGILLTGKNVSNVNITGNIISANTQNGVQFEAGNHTNIRIVNNTVSSNGVGFYISTPTSTYLTNNSITYNEIGIFYTNGTHTAEYNDIYGNDFGMNVEPSATVNAEHNYWGDLTGPNHESLNPGGKGDKVGGDGVNLDFIPYLTKSISCVNTPPTAKLLVDKVWVRPDDDIMFFATNSSDNDGYVYQYYVDFGDGSNSSWTTLSVFTHKYSYPANYAVSLLAMDDDGAVSSPATTIIYVKDALQPLNVNLKLSSSSTVEKGRVNVTVYVTDGTNPVTDVTVTLFALVGGEFNASIGRTDETGYFKTTFNAPFIGDAEKDYVRIVATASKNGVEYADGSDYAYLEVLQATGITKPGTLAVQITAEATQTFSEALLNLTVHVMEYDMSPVEGANVTIEASNGTLSATSGITDSNGEFMLNFTAPMVNEQVNVTITANATKAGYNDGRCQIVIAVSPRTFNIETMAPTVESGKSATITVVVSCNEDSSPVEGAAVRMEADFGSFTLTKSTTDLNGSCTFTFNAPKTTNELPVNIVAHVTKDGYVSTTKQISILVVPPKAEGLPLTTSLLIIIPVVIVVLIVVLIKLKVIEVSVEEE